MGGARRRRRPGHRAAGRGSRAGCGSSTASTAQVLGDVPAAALSDDAPALPPAAGPARRPRGPGRRRPGRPARPRPTAGRTCWPCCPTRPGSTASTTTSSSSTRSTAPGGDAAVLRLAAPGLPPSERGLALTTDSNPTWCSIDPRAGTAATVAEARPQRGLRRGAAHGGGQLPQLRQPRAPRGDVAAVRGHRRHEPRRACALGLPVIGGNVSLYNESLGVDIDPTPVIGVLGPHRPAGGPAPRGGPGRGRRAGAARRQRRGHHRPAGPTVAGRARAGPSSAGATATAPCPPSTSPATRGWSTSSRGLVAERRWPAATALVGGIHDVSGGGLGVALAEMAVRSGRRRAGWPAWPTTTSCSPRRRRGWWCAPPDGRADVAGGRGRRGVPGARRGRRRPHGGRGTGRSRRGPGHRAWRGRLPVPARRAGARSPTDADRGRPGRRWLGVAGRWSGVGPPGLELVEHPVGHLAGRRARCRPAGRA